MKKIAYLIFLSIIALNSCLKDPGEEPGYIPGMGDEPGDPEISTPFVMPDGVELVQAFTGFEETATPTNELLKSVSSDYSCGSGLHDNMHLIGTFKNTNTYPVTLTIGNGSIFKCSDQTYQNGILIKSCSKEIPPLGGTATIDIYLYCLNKSKLGSDNKVTWTCKGITSSAFIMEMVNLLKDKKINYEDDCWNHPVGGYDNDWEILCTKIQDITWNITNGNGMTKDDIDFCKNSVPN